MCQKYDIVTKYIACTRHHDTVVAFCLLFAYTYMVYMVAPVCCYKHLHALSVLIVLHTQHHVCAHMKTHENTKSHAYMILYTCSQQHTCSHPSLPPTLPSHNNNTTHDVLSASPPVASILVCTASLTSRCAMRAALSPSAA